MSIDKAKHNFKNAMDIAANNKDSEKIYIYSGLYALADAINDIERKLREIESAVRAVKNKIH